jgi:hypothetical protein
MSATYSIYRVLQELKETLESLVLTLWKVFVYILIKLETFYVVTVLIQGFQELVEKEHLYL